MNINNKFTFITIPLQSIQSKYDQLLSPSATLIQDMSKMKGDIIILGIGEKMEPTIAK